MDWYLTVLKKYAIFSGRARRKEYWYFVLFNFLISFGLGLIDGLIGLTVGDSGLGLLGGLYSLAVLIPSIAVGVRRLHDTGRSGWWLLIGIIPIIGTIILIVFLASGTQPGPNQYDS
ncbi:MAG TPA: DUF805 domain-containing protein [Coleofasciculaceae cyanobacterium]|jgi:uncharacterized membrane protein YhaH (DUF805 family)